MMRFPHCQPIAICRPVPLPDASYSPSARSCTRSVTLCRTSSQDLATAFVTLPHYTLRPIPTAHASVFRAVA